MMRGKVLPQENIWTKLLLFKRDSQTASSRKTESEDFSLLSLEIEIAIP
jgi:hypothetical protein